MITFVAVPYQLYALTGSPLQVGLLSICDAVPLLLFSAVGGTIADRLDRRKLVLRAESGLMVVAALLAANAFAPQPQVWVLYVLAAVATSLWAIGAPALRALMPGLVPKEQLAASQALQGIYASTGAIVGPALGGLLIAAAGVGVTYAIDAATFVPSLVAALLIAPAPPREAIPERALESLREDWRLAGLVASLTSLRFSIVSGGIACAVGAVGIVAAVPSLFRYDAKGHVSAGRVTGTVPETDG